MDPVSAIVAALVAGAADAAKPTTGCAIGPWGGRRPGPGGDVTMIGATDGAPAAAERNTTNISGGSP
jgi:hypothetical protein